MSMTLAPSPAPRGVLIWVSGLLAASAALFLGYHVSKALDADDAGRLETLLVCSVANLVSHGPSALYGPFTGSNHLVLIHAPLYYRLASLLAYPLAGLGLGAVQASLVAGRMISLAGTLGCFLLVCRLSELDGAPRRSGLWAVCLIASSPILGVLAVMVRPDALAVALQTLGVLLVLRALQGGAPRTGELVAAYVAFALAFCTKQHDTVAVCVSSALLAVACLHGRVGTRPVLLAHAAGLGAAALYLGCEDVLTRGMMSRSVFLLPAGPFRHHNYASWLHVKEVLLSIIKLSFGIVVLAASCASLPRARGLGRLDAALLLYFVAEACALVPLCLYNKGAAGNYALQALVFFCVLVGRALARVVPCRAGFRAAPVVIAAALLLAKDAKYVAHSVSCERGDRASLRAVLSDPAVARRRPGERYFVDRPQHNRRFGAVGLIHDEWLFDAYEAVGCVEPRSRWLRAALTSGPVRTVIEPDGRQDVPGLTEPLPDLGYDLVSRFGGYRVWVRRRGASESLTRSARVPREPVKWSRQDGRGL
jgi:hypothetical protein